MSRRQQRWNVVACGNCGTNYNATGEDPRCPACNARLADFESRVPRPPVRGYRRELEGPDLMRRGDEKPETAPPEEFITAGLILLSFAIVIGSIAMASPLGLQLGLALFVITGVGFGLFKLYEYGTGKRKRREHSSEDPSMLDWLIGGFWTRWH